MKTSPNLDRIYQLALSEKRRQDRTLSLIASENLVYPEIIKIAKYPLTNKYCEGYPNKRFYEGCEIIDEIETEAIEAAKKLFKCSFANVQCYSGSIANRAIYQALLSPNSRILSMEMSSGGHLTHSSQHSFVTQLYEVKTYEVNEETGRIDYDKIREIAKDFRPHLIIAGGSSYPYRIDFQIFREIADSVGAYLFADISHLSGLIVADLHPHCFPHAHVAMTTTHKQLRGTRGALILWNDETFSNRLNKAVFPGNQGGPNALTMAQHAIALRLADTEEYKDYMYRVSYYAKDLANSLREMGVSVLGSETHMILIDTHNSFNLSGIESSNILKQANLITNPNFLPYDSDKVSESSGIRVGTCILALIDDSGLCCKKLSRWIYDLLSGKTDVSMVKTQVDLWLKRSGSGSKR